MLGFAIRVGKSMKFHRIWSCHTAEIKKTHSKKKPQISTQPTSINLQIISLKIFELISTTARSFVNIYHAHSYARRHHFYCNIFLRIFDRFKKWANTFSQIIIVLENSKYCGTVFQNLYCPPIRKTLNNQIANKLTMRRKTTQFLLN